MSSTSMYIFIWIIKEEIILDWKKIVVLNIYDRNVGFSHGLWVTFAQRTNTLVSSRWRL
jgi:hypothetical protein